MSARNHFRAHGRRRVELGATLREREAGPGHVIRVHDLGLGGACIEVTDADAPFAISMDAWVLLEVVTPTLWDPLILRGKIVWVRPGAGGRPGRAGIRFDHRDAAAVYALFQLLGAQAYDA